MRAIVLFLFLVVSSLSLNAQNWQWAHFGAGAAVERLVTDNQGNIYAGGAIVDTAYIGGTQIIDTTYTGIYITKLNSSGSIVWLKQYKGATFALFAMATDSSNNLIVAGYYSSTIDLGDTTLSATSSQPGMFVVKYTPAGDIVWVNNYTGRLWNDPRMDLVTDDQNNIYIASPLGYQSTALLGNLTVNGKGECDFFVLKLDGSGNEQWVQHMGVANGYANIAGMQLLEDSLYVFGVTDSTLDIDNLIFNGSHSNFQFMSKFDLAGNALDVTSFVPAFSNTASAFTVQTSGSIITFLEIYDTITLNGVTLDPAPGDEAIIWIRYSPAFTIEDAGIVGYSSGSLAGTSIVSDLNDNFYLFGYYNGNTVFDTTQLSAASNEFYITKFNPQGDRLWTSCLMGGYIGSMTVNSAGILFIGGNATSVNFCKVQDGIVYDMFVATADNPNVFETDSPTTSVNEIDVPGSKTYPNPFSQTATIKTETLLHQAHLILYDLTGREWINEQNLKGNEVTIDGSNLPDGMYFYRLIDKGALIGSGKVVVAH